MKYNGISLLALTLFIPAAIAGSMGDVAAPGPGGLFIGIGGAYDALRVKSSDSALLNVDSGFPPLGIYSGARNSYSESEDKLIPMAQVGYFGAFNNSGWLWGLELVYQHSRFNVTHNAASIHFFNPVEAVSNELHVEGFKTKMNNQWMLPALIGHSFKNSVLYLGAGPSLQKVEHSVYRSSDTQSGYYIGNLNGFSDEKWLWGGAVQAGIAYFLNPSWFLMLNYTYSKTETYKQNHVISFTPEINEGFNGGLLSFNTSQRLSTQAVSLSINKQFA
ncbi:outer membrane protein [Legionella sp. 16cNR16C]|uniref:outer membrane protein n=1 Tax=Legionella sp. 16cNR16C TaxID=2905656 RepID=UPI001E2B9CB8|nr:outer membrane beta-barrel protein [Legionella sp. 16cNR16C]MCE3045219.1 outer membrane beta-barrel protein [Legionella sp. 16cNR16C]